MKTHRIRVPIKKVDELMTTFHTLPPHQVNACLSDDDFIGYAAETLSTEEVRRIDEHLASCSTCTEQMDPLVSGSEVWRGERGKPRLAALRARIERQWTVLATAPSRLLSPSDERRGIELRHVHARWQALVKQEPERLAAANAEDGREILAWESADEVLSGHVVLESNGDLTFRFSSRDYALLGKYVVLRLGSLQHEEPLRSVSETEVGAEIVIPRSDRPADLQDMTIEIVEERSKD